MHKIRNEADAVAQKRHIRYESRATNKDEQCRYCLFYEPSTDVIECAHIGRPIKAGSTAHLIEPGGTCFFFRWKTSGRS